MTAPLETGGAVPSGLRPVGIAARWLAACAVCVGLLFVVPRATAEPFIWDEDGDHIDDRVESVNLYGYQLSFEQADSLQRQRIAVLRVGSSLLYFVYVVFDHQPHNGDLTSLQAVGMPILHRYEAVPAIRSVATFAQVDSAASMPGVERVEAIPVLYPMLHEAAGSIGARDASGQVFPTWEQSGGADGSGVVIAFLDTGINDGADGLFPGHKGLEGRFLGGATFVGGDSALDTPRDGSVNPKDRGGSVTLAHGTHVASIALGTGGASGHAVGVAPGAWFVDVKALNDAGVGTGIAEALDWCIHNRARDWGGPAGLEGIDVINLSLSSVDQTDGNDVASRLANRAAELGIVVVASMGNDGHPGYVPSPAGADRVIAVGAFDHQRSSLGGDDRFASFDNYGPRSSDGDFDSADEQKPDLLAPGVAILAADGDLTTDGAQYKRMSGTSMAAAFVSGAVAALRSAYPSLTPAQIAELLRATASRGLADTPSGVGGPDPRWLSTIGFGALDLYAARLEMDQPARSQVARFELTASTNTVNAVLRTQRELGADYFVFERAPDVGGSPGAFTPYDSVAATGAASLADPVNRTTYLRAWSVHPSAYGERYWYRVSYTEQGVRYDTPARSFTNPTGPSEATLEVTIVHNAYDHDVIGEVSIGGGSAFELNSSPPELTFPLPASSAASSSDWVNGASTTGNVAWTFRIEVPRGGGAAAYLPPSVDNPWRLVVDEGGFVNRSGRVTSFRLIWHGQDGDELFTGGPTPQQTVEGQSTNAFIPQSVLAVDPTVSTNGMRMGPNPVWAGSAVTFSTGARTTGDLRVYDVTGREIGRERLLTTRDGSLARWVARDVSGHPLPAGVYFARFGRASGVRLVVLRP